MKVRNLVAPVLLGVASCAERETRHENLPLPAEFSIEGEISIDESMYGGALGGYRYDVALLAGGVRTFLLSEQSNRMIAVRFPNRKTVVLSFCNEGRAERVRRLKSVQNVSFYRAC